MEQEAAAAVTEREITVEEVAGDNLLWYARAAYRSRWFCLLMLLSGAGWGLLSSVRQSPFRTVAILRVVNPLIGYHHRSYWEPHGRIAQSQVRLAAESMLAKGPFSLKAELDSWVMRLEFSNEDAGGGRQIVQDLLKQLRTNDGVIASTAMAGESIGLLEVTEIARLLDQMQELLAKLRLESGLPPLDLNEPIGNAPRPHYASDVMVRMPFDELPMAGRFQQLQLAIDRYFSAVAGRETDGGRTVAEKTLLQLQAQVMRQMLINWGRMDLFASAVPENRVQVDLVSEFPVNRLQLIVRDVFLWLVISGGFAILAVIPAIWAIDHWPLIRR